MNAELPTPASLTLTEIAARFPDEQSARAYLESIRWPHGRKCPHCDNDKGSWEMERKVRVKAKDGVRPARPGLYQCSWCKKQFSVTVGTIFESSHIPLHKWLIAWYLLCSSKKGISALQIQRMLSLGSYRSAWFMMHRIRHALKDPIFDQSPLGGGEGGIVEVDETYVGGKVRGHKNAFKSKACVVGLVERAGKKRSVVIPRVTGKNLREAISAHTAETAEIHTDSYVGYRGVRQRQPHFTVNHEAKEYARVRADGVTVTSNTAESSFALIKRGVYGTFHHVSKKHLHRYLAEFDFRWNSRKDKDGERTVASLQGMEGKRLLYREPVAKTSTITRTTE